MRVSVRVVPNARTQGPRPAKRLPRSHHKSFCGARQTIARETGILLPNNQRQHRTSHAPKDVLPVRICAKYCAPCQHHHQTFVQAAYVFTQRQLAELAHVSKHDRESKLQGSFEYKNPLPSIGPA